MKDQFLNAALKYAAVLKWPVFPLRERAKEPATKHGFKDASLDEAQIREWWSEWPLANIGTPTGGAFWVLDMDPRHNGHLTLEKLTAANGALPNTVQQITGGGGRHYLFKMPDQQPITCGMLAQGLDFKGTGGYIVVAPSVHPDTGRRYEWDGADPLAKQPILPAPAWLIPGGKNQHAAQEPPKEKNKWPEGQRNYRLTSFAGKMRRAGLEREALEAVLLIENARRCSPPLDVAEVRKIAQSVSRYTAGSEFPSFHATVLLNKIAPTLELLNGLEIFQGCIHFEDVKRRGPMVIATTDLGEIVWPSTTELGNFQSSRALIAAGTGIFLATPPRNLIRTAWDAAAALLLKLACIDDLALENPLREETRDLLRLMWREAGQPVAGAPVKGQPLRAESEDFIHIPPFQLTPRIPNRRTSGKRRRPYF
jgi:hypothetical protein